MFYLIILILEIVVLYFLSRLVVGKLFHLFSQKIGKRNLGLWLFALLFLPGTFIHEISHFLAALFLLVPVGELKLTPNFKESGVDLGSVAIAKTDPLRRFLIGVAPFLSGLSIIFTILFLISTKQFINVWWNNILAAFLIFEVANSMFASKKDLEGALILLTFIIFVLAFLYLIGFRISLNLSNFFSGSTKEILKSANWFLLVPIGMDVFLLMLLKRLKYLS